MCYMCVLLMGNKAEKRFKLQMIFSNFKLEFQIKHAKSVIYQIISNRNILCTLLCSVVKPIKQYNFTTITSD